MKRLFKALHTLGSVGLMGGYFTVAILVSTAPLRPPEAAAAVLGAVDVVCTWLLLPAMLVTVLSGLWSIAVHRAFADAPWVWVKAGLGVVVFEATLQLQAHARGTAEVATKVLAGEGDPEQLPGLLHTARLALGVLLLVGLLNVVLAIWRPRLRLQSDPPQTEGNPDGPG
jgi:uncharacterized membrane protein